MQIYGLKHLDDARKKYADIRTSIDAWINEIKKASWNSAHDIKKRYPNASFLGDKKVFFNIKGNHYRLLVQVNYPLKIVLVEWIGTHAEYTKKKFS